MKNRGLFCILIFFFYLFTPVYIDFLNQKESGFQPNAGIIAGQNALADSGQDLSITGVNIFPSELHENDFVTVAVMVYNSGPEIQREFRVELFKNRPSSPDLDKRGDLSYVVKRLDSGQTLPIDFRFKVTGGDYNIYVLIDPDNKIPESNKINNISSRYAFKVGAGRADDEYEENDTLAAAKGLATNGQGYSLVSKDDDYFRIQAVPGSFINLDLLYDKEHSNLDLYLLDTNGNILQASKSDGASESIVYKAGGSGNSPIDFIILVKAGENENTYFLKIAAGPMPDLSAAISQVIVTASVPESESTSGGTYITYNRHTLSITITITNNGAPIKNFIYVDLFRNEPSSPLLGEFGNLNGIAISPSSFSPGGDGKSVASVTFTDNSFIDGAYAMYAMVDSENLEKESNETNNVSPVFRQELGGGGNTDDSIEPNDSHPVYVSYGSRQSYLDRIKIAQGTLPERIAKNDDYFAIDLKSGENMRLSLDFIHGRGDLDLYLFSLNDGLNALVRSESAENREVVIYENNSQYPQTVIAQVFPKQVNPAYSLNLAIYPETLNTDLKISGMRLISASQDEDDNWIAVININLVNSGTVAAENFRVDVFESNSSAAPPKMGDISGSFLEIAKLNGSSSAEYQITMPVQTGIFQFYAIVDTNQRVMEVNDANNIFGPKEVVIEGALTDDSFEGTGTEQNDTEIKAKLLNYSTYAGLKALDDDWYKIEVLPGKKLKASLLLESYLGDLDISLFLGYPVNNSISLEYITSGDGIGFEKNAFYENNTGGNKTVYIKINRVDGINGYTLILREEISTPVMLSADLIVRSIVTLPLALKEGDLIRSTVEVINTGNLTTERDCYLDFFPSLTEYPKTGQYSDIFAVIPAGLAPQNSAYLTFEYTLPRGDHKMYASVDVDNRVVETSEANNIFGPLALKVAPDILPNLEMESMSSVLKANEDIVIATLNIANNGTAASRPFEIYFTLVNSSDPAEAQIVKSWDPASIADNIRTGEILRNVEVRLGLDEYVPRGTFFIRAILDWDNRISELNEEDNIYHGPAISITRSYRNYFLETFAALSNQSAPADTVLELYSYAPPPYLNRDSQGNYIINNVTAENCILIRSADDASGNFAKMIVNLKPGLYFARIYGFYGSTGEYNFLAYSQDNIRTGAEDLDARHPSDFEPNNVPGQANRFDLGGAAKVQRQSIASSSDEDWIYFEIK